MAKLRNAIAVADGERGGEVHVAEDSMGRVIQKIAAKHGRAHFCYEAGPTGYGLHRLTTSMGHDCVVAAPYLIPRKPGDRIRTNRRDAMALAKLHRAGELTPVWAPDDSHESVRDLVRARVAAVETVRVHKQQVCAFTVSDALIPPFAASSARRYSELRELRLMSISEYMCEFRFNPVGDSDLIPAAIPK